MKTWVALFLALAVLTPVALGSYGRSETASNLALTAMKMARVRQGVSSYINDYGAAPAMRRLDGDQSLPIYSPYLPTSLTTPIAYLTVEDCLDPFKVFEPSEEHLPIGVPNSLFFNYYPGGISFYYVRVADSDGLLVPATTPGNFRSIPQIRFFIASFGPDLKYGSALPTRVGSVQLNRYDPTNGTLSSGDIIETETLGGGAVFIGTGEVPESRYNP